MISELHNKINNIVRIRGLSKLDDGSIIVSYEDNPTEEQQSLVNAILDNLPLEEAKLSKLSIIENDWQQTVNLGWQTPHGWRLGIDTQDITLLTGAFTLAKEASMMGITDTITIIDTEGQAHALTLQELTVLMLQYGAARSTLSAQYANRKNLVNQATTIEELENI